MNNDVLLGDDVVSSNGYELRNTPGKQEGVFTCRVFKPNEIVVAGFIEKFLEKNNSHASQIGANLYVLHGGLMSKVNHSCEPNCGISVNGTGAHDLVAIREIPANEELSYDYAMRNYRIEHFPKQCKCGAQSCRGKITGWKDLPEHKKKEYAGYAATYLLEMDAAVAVAAPA